MSKTIKEVIIYTILLHSIATKNGETYADNGRDTNIETKETLQQSNDVDKSWSFTNIHNSATFNKAATNHLTFSAIIIITAILVFLFCCGGTTKIKKCIKPHKAQNTSLQQAANIVSMLPIIKTQQEQHFGGETAKYP